MEEKDCTHTPDPLKLVREGTSQQQRRPEPLAPASAPLNERQPGHHLVFAQAYARYLRYYNDSNVASGDWQQFFTQDVSAQLALAAVQEVDAYKTPMQEFSGFLNNLENQAKTGELQNHAGYLFAMMGSLARQLDVLKETLPGEIHLQGGLQNLIRSQLAPGFRRLVAYYRAGKTLNALADAAPSPQVYLFGSPVASFAQVLAQNFSSDWITDDTANWPDYLATIAADSSVYGSGATLFDQVNHLATHNLFTAVSDQFLKVLARVVADAKAALEKTFTHWDHHEPHYALLLAFLRLLEYARQETNTLTQRHLDFYYRDILRLREKPAQPGHAHLLVELARHVDAHLLPGGELFRAGKDQLGKDAFFASDRDLVINQAKVTALQKLYRHHNKDQQADQPRETLPGQHKRLFAAPLANSDDGINPGLTTPDKSWHPFFNKVYADGKLEEIRMPPAEVGFAVASHYLWMAEGAREVTLAFTLAGTTSPLSTDRKADIDCFFTTAEGWLQKAASQLISEPGVLKLAVPLSGEDPAVTPYSAATHGYSFATDLPVILIKMRHQATGAVQPDLPYIYQLLQEVVVQKLDLTVKVTGLRTLAVSNDQGPVDTSKPFQPFGAQPVNGAGFTVGATEVFGKKLQSATLTMGWQNPPAYYISKTTGVTSTEPTVGLSYLQQGLWSTPAGTLPLTTTSAFALDATAADPGAGPVVLAENEAFTTSARKGFVRLVLKGDLGFNQYQKDLTNFLTGKEPKPTEHPGQPIFGPVATTLSVDYQARQEISLNASSLEQYEKRPALFFHLTPFGHAEQHPYRKALAPDPAIYLVPPFRHLNTADEELPEKKPVDHEAEFYIGLTGLRPPQQLSLLFQVADGTADPLAPKPRPHLHWSYLRDNEWLPFAANEVEDQTGELLRSGLVTLALPREASAANTLLPAGQHWIRVAVAAESGAVCRLLLVAAQALQATFANQDNDPGFPAQVLAAGTISKPDRPDAAIKKVEQPFPSFGGRGQEAPDAFYTRVSERLRHKDRGIALWDYERLVLEAFPQIYKVKCLNHTHYDQKENKIIYNELAPGHVTLVTIPNLESQKQRNPLQPYTSLGLLTEIADFMQTRLSCFVQLHVRNPLFEEVRVSFKVRFHEGFDETFYQHQLQQAITRFLSPWAFPGGGSPSFGGKIYKSVLINFVEEQPYVDYVTDFALFHDLAGKSHLKESEVEGSTAVSILVSAPARSHIITPIHPAETQSPQEKCTCEA